LPGIAIDLTAPHVFAKECEMVSTKQSKRLHEEFDADRADTFGEPTLLRTKENPFEISCGECGSTRFVSESLKNQVAHALEIDPSSNPFLCDRCMEELEILAHRQ
jgi:hypothetical protein